MKRFINVRTIFITLSLVVVGAILLLFASASLGYDPTQYVIPLITVAPLVVLATLFALMFSQTKSKKTRPANSRPAKLLSVLTIVSFAVGIVATKLSTLSIPYNQTRGQFVLENTGTASIFMTFLFAFVLIDRQNYVYWPLWNKFDRKQADERQLTVRQRVFEKSYRYLIVLFLGSLLLINFHASRMQKIAPFLIVLSISAMPAVVAAFEKHA